VLVILREAGSGIRRAVRETVRVYASHVGTVVLVRLLVLRVFSWKQAGVILRVDLTVFSLKLQATGSHGSR
jgi:hypothetical protein